MAIRKRRKNARIINRKKERIWCSKCGQGSIISWDDVKEILCGDCYAWEFYRDETKNQTPKFDRKIFLSKKTYFKNLM